WGEAPSRKRSPIQEDYLLLAARLLCRLLLACGLLSRLLLAGLLCGLLARRRRGGLRAPHRERDGEQRGALGGADALGLPHRGLLALLIRGAEGSIVADRVLRADEGRELVAFELRVGSAVARRDRPVGVDLELRLATGVLKLHPRDLCSRLAAAVH